VLAEHDFDIALPHHYFPYYAYLGLPGPKPTPEIMTFHASFWQELRLEGAERSIGKPLESLLFGRYARRTETACLARADRVVVLSDFSREQLMSYYPFVRDKIVKVAGGVDLERFRPAEDRSAVRRALGLPVDRPVMFTARRLVPRMGVENLLEAMGDIRAAHPDVLLVIAGSGRLEGELKSMAGSLGLAEAVRFVGFVSDDDLVRYYQAADVFVLPTLAFEGFGMVTLEALACGTPAVGTPIGATPEILTKLAPQLLLAGTEPHAIRRGVGAVLEWLSDDGAARELRSLCRNYVETNYGWDVAVDALESLAAELMNERKSDG
jgi:glycosyltransferase involved in cell wall biosynthesis